MELEIIIVGAIVGNYLFGVISHIGKDFSIKVALQGLWETIKKLIGASALWIGWQYTQDVEIIGVAYSVVAWTLLGFVGAYNLNSFLLNATNLSGLENVAILKQLDDRLKGLIGKEVELSKVDYSAEITHLMGE
jgi:cell division protein FtsX